MKKKVYISGPITGLVNDKYKDKFREADKKLHEEGHYAIDPSVIGKPGQRSWDYYMRVAIPELCKCDAIYMLEGWEQSKGARLERHIAQQLGMEIRDQASEDNLDTGDYGQEHF